MSQERTVRPSTAVSLISVAMKARRPVFLWGPPGIGKSELIEQIGRSFQCFNENGDEIAQARPIIDMRLLLMDPTDIKGIPYYNPRSNTMKWAQSSELPAVITKADVEAARKRATENPDDEVAQELLEIAEGNLLLQNAILFLDEMNAAPPSVQGAAYQLILNRRVGEYVLPEGVDIVAAGNRESDRGVTYRMPSPLANRFSHFYLEAHFEDWQAWALDSGVHEDVVGFLSKHTQKLFNFDPKSPDKAFATPRSWVFTSELLTEAEKAGLGENEQTTLVAGTVGEGLAIEFAQHRKFAAQLPDPIEVLEGKVTTLKVKEVSAHYSLVISLCYRLKELAKVAADSPDQRPKGREKFDEDEWHKYVDSFIKYMLDNLQPEMIILGARTALKDFKLPIKHKKLKHFNTLYKEHGDMVLGH